MADTFFQDLRTELLAVIRRFPEKSKLVLWTTLWSAFRWQKTWQFSSQNQAFVTLLARSLEADYGIPSEVREQKRKSTLKIDPDASWNILLRDVMAYPQEVKRYIRKGTERNYDSLMVILATLFLAAGSLASPEDAYHLEFSLERRESLLFFQDYFERLGISMRQLEHQGYWVLYTKEGQSIADFLLLAGAHKSMLFFETVRVRKNVLNDVNRAVNCDAANTERVVNSSLKQRKAIHQLMARGKFAELSPRLQATALLRLQYPELSMTELGGLLNPPLGKSGVSHRLRKIIQYAQE